MNTRRPLIKYLTFIIAATIPVLLMAALAVDADAPDAECSHVHDEDCGFIQSEVCNHVHDDTCGVFDPEQFSDENQAVSTDSLPPETNEITEIVLNNADAELVAAKVNKIPGLIANASGTVVTVTGTATSNTTLGLNVEQGISVIWNANFTGTPNPVIDLYGEGSFEVGQLGNIANINAINSFTAIRSHGAEVIVNGSVRAGMGSAIEGAGPTTVIIVQENGIVSNIATSNLRPTINMTDPNNTCLNVIVRDNSKISSTPGNSGALVYGYAIQSYGNIEVSDNSEVYSSGRYGRAVNLVGVKSTITVNGGKVYADGDSGVAISTATTPGVNVTDSTVIINGGLIYASTGMAIHTTGANSMVIVNGGCVFSYGVSGNYVTGNNNVIYTQNHPSGFKELTGDGVVLAWHQAAGRIEYEAGASNDIYLMPSDGVAVWSTDDTDDGIYYMSGGDGGFIKLDVTVLNYNFAVAVSPSEIVFDEVTVEYDDQPPQIVTVTNIGNRPISDLTAILDNGGSSCFEVAGPAEVKMLEPGDTARFSVRRKIGLVTGTYKDVLRFTGPEFDDLTVNLSFTVYPYYIISAKAGNGGNISPAGEQLAKHGDNRTFIITAEEGYHISDILLDGVSMGSMGIFNLLDIKESHTIDAVFDRHPADIVQTTDSQSHVIIASADPYGRISLINEDGSTSDLLDRKVLVENEHSRSFAITADAGYHIGSVWVDGTEIRSTNIYTFDKVVQGHTIHAAFVQDTPGTHIITADAGEGGSISPSGTIKTDHGTDRDITITASLGYHISDVLVDGVSVGPKSAYTFGNITGNHSISAVFAENTPEAHIILACTGPGGQVVPIDGLSGLYNNTTRKTQTGWRVELSSGSRQSFIVVPEPGYRINNVWVDGIIRQLNSENIYTFWDVNANHTIHITFALSTPSAHIIIADADGGGRISPSGFVVIKEGDDQHFNIKANNGYRIADVLVDGISIGPVSSCVFPNVTGGHIISPVFERLGLSANLIEPLENVVIHFPTEGTGLMNRQYEEGTVVTITKENPGTGR